MIFQVLSFPQFFRALGNVKDLFCVYYFIACVLCIFFFCKIEVTFNTLLYKIAYVYFLRTGNKFVTKRDQLFVF